MRRPFCNCLAEQLNLTTSFNFSVINGANYSVGWLVFYCLYDHGMQEAGVRRHRPDALPGDGNETTPPILAMFAVPRSVLPY